MDDKIREAWTVARQYALAAQPKNVADAYPCIQALTVLDEHFNGQLAVVPREDEETA